MAELGELALIAFYAWLSLTIGSYAWLRLSLRRHSVPDGWRFNHRGANMWVGHLSFYGPSDAVAIRSVTVCPLFWTVQRGRSRSDSERVAITTALGAYPAALAEMLEPEGDT